MITKAIIPVGGFGTRFLPATKAQPKEMLTIVDKPVIQYIVESAVNAGITDIIFVTSQNKRAVEDHFDRNFELEYRLIQRKKRQLLEEVKAVSNMANFYYVRQKTPWGDGHAVLQAKNLINDEAFAVLFGDYIVEPTCIGDMLKVYEKYRDPVVGISEVPKKEVSMYGIIGGKEIEKGVYQISSLIEKPSVEKAPSSLAVIGKYILTKDIFAILETMKPDRDGEYRLLDALKLYLKEKPVYGYQCEGTRYDCGNKLGFLKATIDFGLQHKELAEEFRKYLKEKLEK
jgi:UTP--glucose-1-phosphate uridylyltransferase